MKTCRVVEAMAYVFYNKLNRWSTVLFEKLIVAPLVNTYFMEPEGLLPCLQRPATGPYPETEETMMHPHILFPPCSV